MKYSDKTYLYLTIFFILALILCGVILWVVPDPYAIEGVIR